MKKAKGRTHIGRGFGVGPSGGRVGLFLRALVPAEPPFFPHA
ncbi:hypothetical protein X474_06165 [Dethiosulfatarculus sandiegensis]|uniref:Uncharacterized protein n=1 Tax=Dethiosulfatarculus sandiegensis TaxID=1429043 RepID=A0A0D2GIT5_9BACT|nr:hypothetical protein X474_06165 [Dethiosulfatarculus sandiegensis]